jgi:hypothetical protein
VEELEILKPKQLPTIDLSELREVCQQHIDEIEGNEEDEDTAHYIYEAAMEAVFGKEVWGYINSKVS